MSPTGPWALSQDTASPNEPLPYETPPQRPIPRRARQLTPSHPINLYLRSGIGNRLLRISFPSAKSAVMSASQA